MKLPFFAAAVVGAASCALLTDFDVDEEQETIGEGGIGGAPCSPPTVGCDGQCVDPAVDGAHCGACGHDCFGAGCQGGRCEPEQLASGLGVVSRMAIDDTHVYFTTYGVAPCASPDCTVSRFPKSGGAVQLLASDVREATGIALDSTHVYVSAYTAGSGDGVRRIPKAGGAKETIDSCNTAFSVAIDDDFVFFVTGVCGSTQVLRRADKTDPSQQIEIVDPTTDAYAYASYGYLAVGPDDVFWVNALALMIAPKTLAAATELVTAPAHGRGIVRDDDGLWVVFGPDLYAVSEDGASSEPFATMQFEDPTMYSLYIGIATDSTHVYWPSDVPDRMNGTIVKRAKTPADAEPVVIARGQAGPFVVAVDATHAYWANADGSIWRVAL